MESSTDQIKSTFKHALIYSAASIFGKAVGFLMLPVYAHYIRAEGYGIMSMIDVVISVLGLLIGYGIASAMRLYYFQIDSEKQRMIFVSTNITLMIILVSIITLPALLFADFIASLAFGKEGLAYYLVLGMFAFMAETTARNAENYILIQQRSLLYTTISLARLFIGLFLNIYFIVFLEMGVSGFLYSSLMTAAFFSVIIHAYVYYYVGFHFCKEDAKKILKFSLPLVPGYVAMFFRINADRIILRKYLGLAPLGAYEMLLKFVSILVVIITDPLMKSWDIKRMEVCDTKTGPEYMARMFTYHMALSFFLGLILAVEIPLVLKILTPKEFWLGGEIAAFAVLSRVLMDSYYHFFFGLVYAKETFKISVIQFISAGLDVVFNLLLIRHLGILGAVLASSAVSAVQCSIAYFMARPKYFIPFEWRKLVLMSFTLVALFIAVSGISSENNALFTWLINNTQEQVRSILEMINLDHLKNGRIMMYVLNNLSLIYESVIKLLAACSFILILPFLGILPGRMRTAPQAAPIER